ncbi:MAG: DUF1565 domain-containing protein [Candidatus Zixiibacteriota bacterium]
MNWAKLQFGSVLAAAAILCGCSKDNSPAGPTDAECHLSPASLPFGTVAVGSSVDLTFIISNSGGKTLSGTISATCDNFIVIGDASYSLGTGEADTFAVRFTPTAPGNQVCTIQTGSSACTGVSCTGAGASYDYYVDAVAGNDDSSGTASAPFKTITHALKVAGENTTVGARPGTYDEANGEQFPIHLQPGQRLIGDIANKGLGSTSTWVYGAALADPLSGNNWLAAIVAAESSFVAGFKFGAPPQHGTWGVYISNTGAEVAHCTFGGTSSSLYGGIYTTGAGEMEIEESDFLTGSYGVYIYGCTDRVSVRSNQFLTMAIPMDVVEFTPDTVVVIESNFFVGSGQIGIQVQGGAPRIEGNTFNKPDGYATYGAVRCWSTTSNATVRGNSFVCARAIQIDNAATPDLGSVTHPGANNFSGVTVEAVYHMGSSSVSAIGNAWRHSPPVCGTDIVLTGGGSVTWGSGGGENCP